MTIAQNAFVRAMRSSRGQAGGVVESELLLLGARTAVTAATSDTLTALVSQRVAWDRLLAMAEQHRVTPLLYQTLSRLGSGLVPAGVLAQLRSTVDFTVRYNLARTAELVQLLGLLNKHGIAALPFKGPLLAASVYGSLGLRQFSDLDVVVRHTDLPRAITLITTRGYKEYQYTNSPVAPAERSDCLLVHPTTGTNVELQCAVFRWPFRFPERFDLLWENIGEATLAGSTVRSFADEDLLLYLCVHGSKHLWQRMIWICDVAELLRARPGLDWRRVARRAEELGGTRMLYTGLLLARELLGAPPVPLLAPARDDRYAAELAQEVCAHLFETPEEDTTGARTPLYYLRMRERLRDRLDLCVKLYPRSPQLLHVARTYGLKTVRNILGV